MVPMRRVVAPLCLAVAVLDGVAAFQTPSVLPLAGPARASISSVRKSSLGLRMGAQSLPPPPSGSRHVALLRCQGKLVGKALRSQGKDYLRAPGATYIAALEASGLGSSGTAGEQGCTGCGCARQITPVRTDQVCLTGSQRLSTTVCLSRSRPFLPQVPCARAREMFFGGSAVDPPTGAVPRACRMLD
jgi:hypothetical protein